MSTRCLAPLLAVLLWTAAVAAHATDTVATWQRWEHALTSDRDYANPCAEVTVRVQFDGPQGQRRQGSGCWDGGRRFLVRGVFPLPGEWRWHITCSDPANRGLAQSGVVRVTRSTDAIPLHRHGYLRVSADGRLLEHHDGTPFLWLGDTCWAAPARATFSEWQRYVADRVAKGYSVLQLAVGPDWALEGSPLGIAPFLSALPDITKPNPAYFQQLDRKLALANDRGLVVMMVGLMETPYRYPPPEQVAVFSRYVAARYGSFAVIFSPSFDSGIHENATLAAAQAIREAAPDSLVTMHMGTGVGPHFHGAAWLSFDMVQSGHNGGNRNRQSARATGMAAEVLALPGRKPIVNGEAIYEGDLGAAADVRRTAWLSFLSGAVGYTAGINEVYAWEDDAVAKMGVPSSQQVALLGRVLRAVPWWRLEPAPGRICNQPAEAARLMAFALTADRRLGLAYLPDNRSIDLDLAGGPASYAALWVSPVTGACLAGPTVAAGRVTLRAPDRRDWVLAVAPTDSTALQQIRRAVGVASAAQPDANAAISFAPGTLGDGLVLKQPADGRVVYRQFQGTDCAVNEDPQRNSYLYLDLDDRLAFRGGVRQMRVEMRLQSDRPLVGLQLQYDAEGPADVEHTYQAVPPTARKQEGGWTVVQFVADQPYLGGRQNAGADFRLYLDRALCRIAEVKVTLARAAPPGS